jgi:hypothetical protein
MLPFVYFTRATLAQRLDDHESAVRYAERAVAAETLFAMPTGYDDAARRLLEALAK